MPPSKRGSNKANDDPLITTHMRYLAVRLLIGTALRGVALCLYLLFNGLVSLYVVSALYGLFQGGIVRTYGIIIRQYFPPKEAGTLGLVSIVGFASLIDGFPVFTYPTN
jgi:hypothetical protein